MKKYLTEVYSIGCTISTINIDQRNGLVPIWPEAISLSNVYKDFLLLLSPAGVSGHLRVNWVTVLVWKFCRYVM